MDDKQSVPYIAFEGALAREERTIKRLITLTVVITICWLLTIAGLLWYFSLPVEESVTQTVEGIENIDHSEIHNVGD